MRARAGRKRSVTWRGVRFLAVSIVLLSLAVSLVIAQMISFVNTQQKTVETATLERLTQTHHNLWEVSRTLQALAMQIYFDPAVAAYNIGHDRSDSTDMTRARQQLYTYLSIYDHIHSIYFYNARTGVFYTTLTGGDFPRETFHDAGAVDLVDRFLTYDEVLLPRKIPSTLNNTADDVYTVFFYDHSATNFEKRNVVVINIRADYILSYLQSEESAMDNTTLLLNGQGDVLARIPAYPKAEDWEASVVSAVLAAGASGPPLKLDTPRGCQFVVHIRSSVTDWILVQLQPYDALFAQVSRTRNTVLIVSLITLAMLSIFVALLPREVVRPIASMERDAQTEKENRRRMAEEIRQQYLRLLLHSDMRARRDEVQNRLAWLECDIDLSASYELFILLLDYQDADTSATETKRLLLSLLEKEYGLDELGVANFVVDAERNQLVWAVDVVGAERVREKRFQALRRIMETMRRHTGAWVTVIASGGATPVFGLERLYAAANALQEQRFLTGLGSIIESAGDRPKADYAYPVQTEGELTSALRQGDESVAMRHFDQMLEAAIATGDPNVVMFTLYRLGLGLRELASALSGLSGEQEALMEAMPNQSLYHCRTVEEAGALFRSAIAKLAGQYQKTLLTRHDQLMEEAVRIMESQYDRPELDLTYLADRVKLSPVYFGRLFKMSKGKTVGVYIQTLRIEKACAYLDNTSLNIQQIAEQTGFSSTSYFSTVFKKHCGMSPNEYRHRVQANPPDA